MIDPRFASAVQLQDGTAVSTAEFESISSRHFKTSSSVIITLKSGRTHVVETFNAKKLSVKHPELEGLSGADLPDPKSLKKARKKADALRDVVIEQVFGVIVDGEEG